MLPESFIILVFKYTINYKIREEIKTKKQTKTLSQIAFYCSVPKVSLL